MTKLHYGIVLPYADPRQTAEQARQAEESGWDAIFVGDAVWTHDPLINLAAAAMVTTRIRLGTQVLCTPVRLPWSLDSQATALDHLSNGRLILGLGMGATWMGWKGFPNTVMDTRSRAELLDETIDILTLMARRKPFDFDGKHYQIKLSLVEEEHYPPPPIQQPRVPLWIPAVWPRMKSMRRALKCDGIFPVKMDAAGQFVDLTPADLREIRAFIAENRQPSTPFEFAVDGRAAGLSRDEAAAKIGPWIEAGATWWIEPTWELTGEALANLILGGPPKV